MKALKEVSKKAASKADLKADLKAVLKAARKGIGWGGFSHWRSSWIYPKVRKKL